MSVKWASALTWRVHGLVPLGKALEAIDEGRDGDHDVCDDHGGAGPLVDDVAAAQRDAAPDAASKHGSKEHAQRNRSDNAHAVHVAVVLAHAANKPLVRAQVDAVVVFARHHS